MGIISKLFSRKANDLQKQKHNLIRAFEKKKIGEEEYKEKLANIEGNVNAEVRTLLDKNDEEIRNPKPVEEVNQMADEDQKDEKKKVEKPLGEMSYTRLILKALALKHTKNADSVADKVLEMRPGRDKKKVITHIKTIIGLVVRQEPARWKKYEWDQENFLLKEKEA